MHEPLQVLVGAAGPGTLPTASDRVPDGTVLLDLGPDHPSGAGLLELRLWTDSDRVHRAEVVVGAMHRGAEKLFEVRDYRQILMLADRHDWHAPFFGELAVAMACEDLLGLALPERAVWLRTLLAEHTRILSHAAFLAYVPHLLEARSGLPGLRAALRSQTARLTGNRIHPMVTRVGGLAADADPDWLAAEKNVARLAVQVAAEIAAMVDSQRFVEHAAGVAPLSVAVISEYGVSGPPARASGLALDLRTHASSLAYGELSHLLPTGTRTAGDAQARLALLTDEVAASAHLVSACVSRLDGTPGPVSVRTPQTLLLPEGETYIAVEAPLGMTGVLLVSRGDKTPWRLKLRTPSFNNVAALEQVLIGVPIGSLDVALASVGYVVGDIDR